MLTRVRCSGCVQTLAVSEAEAPLRNRVWCTERCKDDYPVGAHETRDAVITELSRLGRSDGQIAGLFGVGRSRVQQIASSRRS